MNTNQQLIKDAITAGDTLVGTGKGGRLNPEQADKFITYIVDETEFLKDVKVERMRAPEKQLDFFQIASRIIRKATEAVSPSELAGITTSRKELRSVKIRLSADITTEFAEDNIEGESAKDRIARELAQQFSNDIADLMLNGDTEATGADANFLTIGDGIIKQAKVSTDTLKFDLKNKNDYKNVVFPGMLKLMPNKFKNNKRDLRFYCAPGVAEAYILSIADRITVLGDDTLKTGKLIDFLGIKIFPVTHMPENVIILTNKNNLVMGIQRQMKIYSQFNQRKDQTEYTMYMRVDPGKIVWDEALVIGHEAS